MISTVEVKIKKVDDLSSIYIENELKKMGYDFLRWAITSYDKENYILNVAIVED
jgi:hypothetical protein